MIMLLRCLSMFITGLAFIVSMPAHGAAAELSLWRLECGLMTIEDISIFSDANHYDGVSGEAVNGCYLIRHVKDGNTRYLLWDAGLPAALTAGARDDGDGWASSLSVTIEDQLRTLGLSPTDIDYLGISHYHGDHIGQADILSEATLLMGQPDIDYLMGRPIRNARTRLKNWLDGDRPVVGFENDYDIFGDGSVTILSLPGHTHGHAGLLVRLNRAGPVLLSGDLYHYHKEIGTGIVSLWNKSRAETLASQLRFETIIETLQPITIIQHDRQDIAKLPAFPKALE